MLSIYYNRCRPHSIINSRFLSSKTNLRKTPLWSLHNKLGATTTSFSGWEMPIQYSEGIIKEHHHCRTKAGLFDVSHMLGVNISGKDRIDYAETIFPSCIRELGVGDGVLTNIPNNEGGLVDDCIITNMGDYLYLVINAGHECKDLPHMEYYRNQHGGDINITTLPNNAILALQGPKASDVLSRYITDIHSWYHMNMREVEIDGIKCLVSRSGYTGEDGFEITCCGNSANLLASKLLCEPEVKPIGLGARDSLRLEAGLCLYGNDIDITTTPIESMLAWTICKRRREQGGFIGSDVILGQLANKSLVKRKRIGLISEGAPVRSGDKIYNTQGDIIGVVTSGLFGPTINKPIGMGYVKTGFTKIGTNLLVKGKRNKFNNIIVSKMPFITTTIVRKPKT